MVTMNIANVENDSTRKKYVTRFSNVQRIEHIIFMVTFIVLSVTGLAQRYYTAGWAEWCILVLGGIEYTRLVHRIFAVIFILHMLYHLGFVAYLFFVKHKKLNMVPTLKDFNDVITELRYSFRLSDRPALFGRFDYRQKFEYWGVMFGSVVIIISGLILTFPIAATRILPGQVVAAAVEFHGFEATLAVLTIVIFHIYDVVFRPGIFPGDTTIFTGKISLERMIEEHPVEYLEREDLTEIREKYPLASTVAEPPPSDS